MTFNIETKFDIGEIVYIADFYGIFFPCRHPRLIRNFDIRICNNKTNILYLVVQDDITERVPEDWVFASYEECTKWCEERNKSL